MVLKVFLNDQVGPKSKDVDFSLVFKGFLGYQVGTKSKNVDFSLVFKAKIRKTSKNVTF